MYIISRCIYCVNTQFLIVATAARLVSIATPAIQPIPTVAMSLPKDMDMEARSCSLANQRPAVFFGGGVLTNYFPLFWRYFMFVKGKGSFCPLQM